MIGERGGISVAVKGMVGGEGDEAACRCEGTLGFFGEAEALHTRFE